jgi:4-amino-4-deoxy-L-arabinose transferase-like glycosyltransferase
VRDVEAPRVGAAAARLPRWVFWSGLTLAVVLYLVQGYGLAHRMVTWTDESAYVHLGYLAAGGQISLFQDELTGSRMPLPFWVLGASQRLWGRSLLAARLTALGIGLVALVLTALIARRLAGDLAGLLAVFFFATQGVLVGYFATGTYHSLAAAILLGGLTLIIAVRRPWGPAFGILVLSLLFLTRTNLWPVMPGVLLLLVCQARTVRERLGLLAAAVAVPLVFFLSDARHLKILAYVPVIGRLVRSLGYPAGFALVDVPEPVLWDRLWAFVRLGRMYEFWALAALLLCLIVAMRRLGGRATGGIFSDGWTVWIAVLIVYIGCWQVLILWKFPKAVVGWFPSFAPLCAVLLGVGFARLLSLPDLGRRGRVITTAALVILFLAPVIIVRHPLRVSGADAHAAPLQDLEAAAAHFRRDVKPGAKVFLWGDSLPLYLAGILPYLQQIHSTNTYALVEDRVAIEKSGLWGRKEMERWLSTDADYVVLEPRTLDEYRARHPEHMARLDALLREHFDLVDKIEDYRWQGFELYARRR